jgi:hypothetical protein
MFLIITKYLIPRGFRGITTFPFIFIRYPADKENRVLLIMKNTLAPAIRIISTSLFYMVHFRVSGSVRQYKNRDLAYRNSFEREGYSNETNIGYLKSRPVLNLENIWR